MFIKLLKILQQDTWFEGVIEMVTSNLDNSRFKKKSKEELKESLTKMQYEVTQEDATEPSFRNEYNSNFKEDGETPAVFDGSDGICMVEIGLKGYTRTTKSVGARRFKLS